MMKNRFLLTAVMLLFVCIAANGQAQKLTAMKDAGTLKYKGVTYHISIGSVGKDTKGNTTVEVTSDAEVSASAQGGSEQLVAAISKYMMVKIVAGDQTYSTKNVEFDYSVTTTYDTNGPVSRTVSPKKLSYIFETTAAPERIIVYNDDVESISFDVPKTAVKSAVTTTTAQTKSSGQVTFEKNAYTVSVGSITNDQQGNITAEILSAEVIDIPMKNGVLTMPFIAVMGAGGKTVEAERQVAAKRNSLTFKFKSTEAPDKIIVYGNDGKDQTGVTLNVAKDMVAAVQTAQPVQTVVQTQPAVQQAQPAVQQTQPAQQSQSYQQPAAQQTQPATQYQQPATQKQQTPVVTSLNKTKTDYDFKKWYVESGLSIYILAEDGESEVFAGFILNGGFYTSPNSRFSLDMSFNFLSEDAGTFTYTKSGSSTVHKDGKISRVYVAIPVQFTWNYVFDINPIFSLRLGPSAGFTSLSESYSFSPQVDNAPKYDTESVVMLSAGGGIGATWNIKKFFIDAGYKLLWNSETDITDPTIAHQITATFGWRF